MSKYLAILLCALSLRAFASLPADPDADLDARVQQLAGELRCLVCQNQSLADSQAPLALDLRSELRERLRHGDSDAQVLAYLSERYGLRALSPAAEEQYLGAVVRAGPVDARRRDDARHRAATRAARRGVGPRLAGA